ncbi:60Kd inner membrane protein-domain-containing protein [Gautieria morchelliformis]|nr:60Kd inner membrane protein-domain-containing protein [Gautieria morchelliformis]
MANNEIVPDVTLISLPPPPLQLGDLRELGFSNMTPVGAVQAALEFVQVTTGLPWWGTIVLTTTLVRLALVHFAIKQVRTTAAMAPVRPQMDALMAEVKEAKLKGDNTRAQVAVLKVRKLQRETGTGLGAVMGGPLLQGASSIVMFLAIKKLCDFPLAQLKYEGVAWLPSLAAADPYYILPALSVGIMNLQIYLGRVDMAAAGKASLHFINVFPIISVASFAILAYLPGGLLIYLVSNIALVVVQGVFLRTAAVRRALKLPPLVPPKPEQFPSMRDTWVAIKKWFANQERQAVVHAEQRSHIPVFPAQSGSPTPLRRPPAPRSMRHGSRGRKN